MRFLPSFPLRSHRLKAPLQPIPAIRNAFNERERLRVFREHRREHPWDNVSEFWIAVRLNFLEADIWGISVTSGDPLLSRPRARIDLVRNIQGFAGQ